MAIFTFIGRHQDGVGKARSLEVEQPAEPADLRIGSGPARGAHQGFDLVDHGVARVDIDACLRIGQAVLLLLGHRRSPSPRGQ
jgi:hypothetical protein